MQNLTEIIDEITELKLENLNLENQIKQNQEKIQSLLDGLSDSSNEDRILTVAYISNLITFFRKSR